VLPDDISVTVHLDIMPKSIQRWVLLRFFKGEINGRMSEPHVVFEQPRKQVIWRNSVPGSSSAAIIPLWDSLGGR
jgi:hypothetical protein